MIEVEAKYALLPASWPRLWERLRPMQPTLLQISDTYYDTTALELLRQAVFVRIRNQRRLEFKFNEQAAAVHIQSTERAFSLEPERQQADAMNALFARFLPQWHMVYSVEEAIDQNCLIELAYIENTRMRYVADELTICVDQVEGLGDFLEIEASCEEGEDTSQLVAKVQSFVNGLDARRLQVGYVELWLQKHHPQAYQVGKYQEDV